MTEIIRYRKTPVGLNDIGKFPALEGNWNYSYKSLKNLNLAFNEKLDIDSEKTSIVLMGSFGRYEACPFSDIDLVVVSNEKETEIKKIRSNALKIGRELRFLAPNPKGVFSQVKPIDSSIRDIGSHKVDDSFQLSQRLLLLMESTPVWNKTFYDEIIDRLLERYSYYVIEEPKKEQIFLLNDTIRYFRTICVNYQHSFWKENEKWAIRNIKLNHSRIIMFAGLLFLILNSSKNRTDKVNYMKSHMKLTPLERIIHVYNDNNDTNVERVVGSYNVFLGKMSDKNIRNSLNIDYVNRYLNPIYAELKVNACLLTAELTRFIFSMMGHWTNSIFEYLIF